MHILFDLRTYKKLSMSAGIYLADMVDAFLPALQEGDQVTILMALKSYLPWEQIEHPAVHYLFARETPCTAAGRKELNAIVQRIHPDLWWTADAALTPPAKTRRHTVKSVFAIEDFRHLYGSAHGSGLGKWWQRRRARQHLLKADAIVCPNKAIAAHLAHRLGIALRHRLVMIPSGIHPVFRVHQPDEILQMRRKWLIPQRYLLMVSTSVTAHYLTPVLEALGTNTEVSSIHCVILGDTKLPNTLRETIRDCHLNGLVRFIDNEKLSPAELSALYSGAFLLFEPSQDVAYQPSILRAMACGTPVICAACAANEDVFKQAVLRVHPTDTREWSQALSTFTLSAILYERQVQRGLAFAATATSTTMAKTSFAFARRLCTSTPSEIRRQDRAAHP